MAHIQSSQTRPSHQSSSQTMPSFSDEKREQVQESLRETGRELFVQQGIQKTTIAELTEPAGIGTGTFYQYFDSKEALYIEILEQESKEVIPRLLRESFETHDDPEAAITALLEVSLDEIETNPIFRQIILEEGELPQVREKIPQDEADKKRERAIGYFLPYIEQWHDEGKITGPDPETIAHTIRAVVRLAQQRDRIGDDRYSKVRKTLIEAVAAGLTREQSSGVDSNE